METLEPLLAAHPFFTDLEPRFLQVMVGCAANEICLDAGLCAPMTAELRYCVKWCESNDDCRGGYECRRAGTRGSMALISDVNAVVHFCAPQVDD